MSIITQYDDYNLFIVSVFIFTAEYKGDFNNVCVVNKFYNLYKHGKSLSITQKGIHYNGFIIFDDK